MATQHQRTPIAGPEDAITIRGRYLYRRNKRFFVRGIAFPNDPPSSAASETTRNGATVAAGGVGGWISVLEQLANDTDINTVRIYEMDCDIVSGGYYDPFFRRASELGIYVVIPLTSTTGDGNLKRDKLPPDCYPKTLFQYGATCLDAVWDRYPNVLMGVVGNEVMNNILTYRSAPCVKAYLNDLTAYGNGLAAKRKKERSANTTNTIQYHRESPLPLLYATQHDSPTADVLPEEAIKLTLDYLSCGGDDNGAANNSDREEKKETENNNPFVFGINIESWCSSSETFEFEDDGVSESSYHALWRTFSGLNQTVDLVDAVTGAVTTRDVPPVAPDPAGVPVVFSELGCSRRDFNRDNPAVPPGEKHIRDWKQIPLVSSPNGSMADVWSGFVAYGYDGGGNQAFVMMGNYGDADMGDKWNGKDPLPSSKEYENFRTVLSEVRQEEEEGSVDVNTTTTNEVDEQPLYHPVSCQAAAGRIQTYLGVELYPLSRMPSHFHRFGGLVGKTADWSRRVRNIKAGGVSSSGSKRSSYRHSVALLVALVSGIIVLWMFRKNGNRKHKKYLRTIGSREPFFRKRGNINNNEKSAPKDKEENDNASAAAGQSLPNYGAV